MITYFQTWLDERGLTTRGFYRAHGLPQKQVCELARPGSWKSRETKSASFETLAKISEITGIPAGQLVEDVIEAEPQ